MGEAQYQTCLNQTFMYVLCSGLSPSLSASGSLKGADMRAPPGIERRPNRAGMRARRTLPGRRPLRLPMRSTIIPVSSRLYPRTVMRATAAASSRVMGSVSVPTATSQKTPSPFPEVAPMITEAARIASAKSTLLALRAKIAAKAATSPRSPNIRLTCVPTPYVEYRINTFQNTKGTKGSTQIAAYYNRKEGF